IREANGALRRIPGALEGEIPLEWMPDGKHLLVNRAADDPFGGRELAVLATDSAEPQAAKRLFKASARTAAVSPDGKRVLFIRKGRPSSRRGYVGAAAGQLWLATLGDDGSAPKFERLSPDAADANNEEYASPTWLSNDEILFLHQQNGVRDLVRRDLRGSDRHLTTHVTTFYGSDDRSDAGVEAPSLARGPRRVVYRKGFDLWFQDLDVEAEPRKIEIRALDGIKHLATERRSEKAASEVAWTKDGKQVAFVAGGDLWVMDRILKDPVRVTTSAEEEREPLFDDAGDRLYFCSDREGHEPDIWYATRKDADKPWFLQTGFELTRVTNDTDEERGLAWSPDGKRLTFVRRGDLIHTDLDGKGAVVVDRGWDDPSYDWSPDGKYVVFARNDSDFNSDIWIANADGSGRVVNLSRHPDNDYEPTWSPDGGRIAWVGRREDGERDLFYVHLDPKLEEQTERERTIEKALEALKKGKKPAGKGPSKKDGKEAGDADKNAAKEPKKDDGTADDQDEKGEKKNDDEKNTKKPEVNLVVDEIHDRIHRIRVSGSERGLLWSHDGKELWFQASIDGKSGAYAITFPDKLKPAFKVATVPSSPRVLADKSVVGHVRGVPAALEKDKVTTFAFDVHNVWDWQARRVAVLRQVWRAMRERFYDPAMNGLDWDAVGKRFESLASECIWPDQFELVANAMLGELNASHMGYRGAPRPGMANEAAKPAWRPQVWHLGLVFDPAAGGPGLLVERSLRKGPARRFRSRIKDGERVVKIDGHDVDASTDVAALLYRDTLHMVDVVVRDEKGEERTVTIEPVTAARARGLIYDDWVQRTRETVDRLSGGKLGWLHIRGMNMFSFSQLEEDIYAAGAGKEGLLIDVRWNGGGSTADHVLTVLCQPEHAMTIPRGGSESGYPQDRKVYATWNKPIVLLCNERSFSNAEILSHAIKTLGRGRVVGERTAGGVISTGGARLMDGSFVRMPFRAWFLSRDGSDMELNGAMPDLRVQIQPADEEAGRDPQLETAVQTLLEDVKRAKMEPRPSPRYRSGRNG
ncbi:MAG: PD40 domain-containing protein, partial [Planctomycetes bacterium]|nr:PD40 domain-containing protein [Planctomycetota bacterium]